jgi:glycosyltransferase involved in cell wall biosynthesis
MPNIWFDVTTTVHWRRPPVGVVRVEAECFKYLARLGLPYVRFCHFDKAARAYREIHADYVMGIFNLHGYNPPEVPQPQTSSKRLVDQLKQRLQSVPGPVRKPLVKAGKQAIPAARTLLHHVRGMKNRMATAQATARTMTEPVPQVQHSVSSSAPFGASDVLISAGLDWDQKDLPYLYQLKMAHGMKVILFCYDLIPVLFPHLCVGEVAGIFARYFVDVAWCADHVMCISKSSQRDLLQLVRNTGAPQTATSIIHLGGNLPVKKTEAKIEDLVRGRYLLFVSTIERRKNHEVIYRAMTHLADEGRKDLPTIVFVGMVGWGVRDFLNDVQIDWRTKNRFLILNHVSDEHLSLLYQHSLFTLYPSLYEGWGLPLAEGLAHGKFCLAANTSSLPEVGGPLVEYLDPWDSRKWAQRIAFYLDNPGVLAEREAAVKREYVPYKWDDTGKHLFEVAELLLWSRSKVAEQP